MMIAVVAVLGLAAVAATWALMLRDRPGPVIRIELPSPREEAFPVMVSPVAYPDDEGNGSAGSEEEGPTAPVRSSATSDPGADRSVSSPSPVIRRPPPGRVSSGEGTRDRVEPVAVTQERGDSVAPLRVTRPSPAPLPPEPVRVRAEDREGVTPVDVAPVPRSPPVPATAEREDDAGVSDTEAAREALRDVRPR